MRIVCILTIFFVFFSNNAFAADTFFIEIQITIDKEKSGGNIWDRSVPLGAAPDPYGSITLGRTRYQIKSSSNTYSVSLSLNDVRLEKGDKIYIELYDKDDFRFDDTIIDSSFKWEGRKAFSVRMDYATVEFRLQ